MIALFLMLACGSGSAVDPVALEAEPIALAECGVCGMVVGEQPSPRAQVVYRDGTHLHTCSIEEARALAQHPGPRGRAAAVWVESLPADFDWTQTSTETLPWVDAKAASYVFGAERTRVMGVPVLSYADPDVASKVAHKLGTKPVSWTEMLDAPVPQIPSAADWTPPGGSR